MSSKEQTHSNDKASSKHQSRQPEAGSLDILAQRQVHPATSIQRAGLDPKSLTPHDVLRLQRTLGNQSVGRLLAEMGSRQSAAEIHSTGLLAKAPDTLPPTGVQRLPHAMGNPAGQRVLAGNRPSIQPRGAYDTIQRWRPATINRQIYQHLKTIKANHLQNFIPSSGMGKFDARFDPGEEILYITLKLFFNFQGDWLPIEQDDFRNGFIQKAEAAWSEKFTMRCTKLGWEGLVARPRVQVLPVGDINDSHYDVKVKKGSGQAMVGRQHFSDPNARPDAQFFQEDIIGAPQGSGSTRCNLVITEGSRIQDLIDGKNAADIEFKLFRAKITDDKLSTLFDTLQSSRRPDSPPIPIIVTGFSNKREVGIPKLAHRRAGNVARSLEKVRGLVPFEKTGAGADRKVSIQVPYNDPKMTQEIAGAYFPPTLPPEKYRHLWPDYTASVHEFGHMLGNPDEYVAKGTDTGPVTTIQQNYSALVHSAGLEAPVFGTTNTSLMSAGADLLIRHYTPLWDALGAITDGIIDRDQWKLEGNT